MWLQVGHHLVAEHGGMSKRDRHGIPLLGSCAAAGQVFEQLLKDLKLRQKQAVSAAPMFMCGSVVCLTRHIHFAMVRRLSSGDPDHRKNACLGTKKPKTSTPDTGK